MHRESPPFRAEHIGSLNRPAELIQRKAEHMNGAYPYEALQKDEDEAIRRVVELQRSTGMKTLTDGEFRRFIYFEGVYDQLDGMEVVHSSPIDYFAAKLRRSKFLYGRDFLGLKKIVHPEEVAHVKVTMCGPELAHFHHGTYTYEKGVYSSDEEYFADVVKAYQEEINELYEHGCRNIQIDEANIAFFCDDAMNHAMKELGIDPDVLLDRYIRLINDCIRDRPKSMNAGVHLCRGNTKEGFTRGGYGRIATKLFQGVEANCFYLEYDTIRAGGFEPLKHLPPNKLVVLGLVSTRTAELEDPERLRTQIYEAARIISDGRKEMGMACTTEDALDQICISPQCGFSSVSLGIHGTVEEDVRRKLALVVQVAESVWGEV